MKAKPRRGAALLLLAASLGASPGAASPAKPQRIMSMNQCTDLLLLQMVPQRRIASVTYLAADGARELFPGRPLEVLVNHGTAEDVLKARPDLIVADAASTPLTRRLARRVGAPLVELRPAVDFDGVRRNLRRLGEAVGEQARAEALIARMDSQLSALAASPPPRRRRVVLWSGGAVPGKATLANAIIEAAGAVDVAAAPGPVYAAIDAEQLLAVQPQAILQPRPHAGPLRGEDGQARMVRRLYGSRRIAYDEVAFSCGLPQSADAAVRLRRALDAPSS